MAQYRVGQWKHETRMLDIVITGGLGSSSLGAGAGRYRRGRRADRRDRRARQPRRARRRADRRRRRADRHPGRHRPACPLPLADRRAGRHPAPADRSGPARVSQAALHGGTTTIIDFALVEAGDRVQSAIERRQTRMGRRLPLRLRLSHDGAGQDRARDPAAADRSGRGRAPVGQDLHDRHHALAARAAWSISATSGRC